MASIKGITIEIGGDTQPLQKALSGVNKETSALQKELNTINRLLKLDPTNTTLLAQKQQVLAQAIEQTTKKLDTLKTAQKQAADQLTRGEIGEAQYRELERQVLSTERSLNNLENQAKEVDAALEAAGNESQEAAGKLDNVGDAADKGQKDMKGFSAGAVAAITAAAAAIGAVVSQISSFVNEAVEGTKELRGDLSKLQQNAQAAGASFDGVSQNFQYFVALTEEADSSVEALSNLLQAGFKDETLTAAVNNLSGAVIKFPDTLKIESLADSLQETLATGAAIGQYGELLERLGINLDDFNAGLEECTTAAEKQEYAIKILSENGLADLNEQYREGNKDLIDYSIAQTRYNQTLAKVGEAMQPVMTAFMNIKTTLLEGLLPAIQRIGDDLTNRLASPQTQHMIEQLGKAIGDIAEGFVDFAVMIMDNGQLILGIIASIGAAFAAWKISTLFGNITKAFQDFAKAFSDKSKTIIESIKQIDKASMATIIGTITAVIGVVISLATALRDSNEEINKIADDTNTLVDATKDAATAFHDGQAEIAATAQIAKEYADEVVNLNDRIKQLEASEQDATAEKQLLAEAVEQLNQATGETTATIDENTGVLNENSAAIYASIEAMEQAARESAYLDYWRQLQEQQVQLEIQQRKNAIAISEEVGAWEVFTGSAAKARDAYFATEEAMKNNAAEMEALETVMNEQGLTVADLAGKHGELQVTVDGVTTSVQALTEAEALHLLRMQENGAALSETEAAQLEAYKASNAEQYKSLEELVKKESELYKKRIEIVTNTNEAITLSDAVTLEQRIKNLDANAAAVESYEKGMQTIRENAIADGNESMLRYLETLGDYSQESMAIVSQLVTDYAEGGGKMANELADKYISALDSRSGDMQSATYQTGSDAETAGGEGISSNPAMETEAEKNMRETVDGLRDIVNDSGNFYFLGMGVMNKMADGMRRAAANLYSVANSIVSQLKSILTVNISATATSSGTQIRGYATGGVVSHPSIVQVAEVEPEAIIPLSKMGAIVQAVLNNKGVPSHASYGGTTYLQPKIEIYAQKLTDAEMRRATDFVSREFAKMTGGQLS